MTSSDTTVPERSATVQDGQQGVPPAWGNFLHAFALPSELLEVLQVRLTASDIGPTPPTDAAQNGQIQDAAGGAAMGSWTCQVCGGSFESSEAQRAHFRSDWHRFNVKRHLHASSRRPILASSPSEDAGSSATEDSRSYRPVGEEQFAKMIEDLKLRGSDSESSDDEEAAGTDGDDEDATINRLLRRGMSSYSDSDTDSDPTGSRAPRSPIIWLTASPLLPKNLHLGVYRCVLPHTGVGRRARIGAVDGDGKVLEELKSSQVGSEGVKHTSQGRNAGVANGSDEDVPPHWTVLMMGGGHFAGAVVSLRPKLRHVSKHKTPEKEIVVLAHKTFHRYTTRRKQGGGQSAHDSGGKGAAKSAGANLRRYNEQALAEDVRGVLTSWADLLNSSSLIFLRASRSNSNLFFHPPSSDLPPLLDRSDPRLRTFPFPTRRATLEEAVRCVREVIGLKVVRLSEEELKELEEPPKPRVQPAKPSKEPKPSTADKADPKPKLSPEEVLYRDRWERVVDMVQKGRVDALSTFLARRQEEDGPEGADEWTRRTVPVGMPMEGWTLLHVAAAADQPEAVDALLTTHRLDPTALTSAAMTPAAPTKDGAKDAEGQAPAKRSGPAPRTAYELAPSRPTRNAFRRVMANHPDWCDWAGAARVPSALTEEMEVAQAGKGKDRKAKMKERTKERDAARAEQERQQALVEAQEAERQRAAAAVAGNSRKANGPQKLGGAAAAIIRDRNKAEASGLSEEQKMRLDRERRARAAEARMSGRS